MDYKFTVEVVPSSSEDVLVQVFVCIPGSLGLTSESIPEGFGDEEAKALLKKVHNILRETGVRREQ